MDYDWYIDTEYPIDDQTFKKLYLKKKSKYKPTPLPIVNQIDNNTELLVEIDTSVKKKKVKNSKKLLHDINNYLHFRPIYMMVIISEYIINKFWCCND